MNWTEKSNDSTHSFNEALNYYQSELVSDFAVPVSVRQVVLFCAL